MADQSKLHILEYEIAHGTQRSVALAYAFCREEVGSGPKSNCPLIHGAIIKRWSVGALDRILAMMFKIHKDLREVA